MGYGPDAYRVGIRYELYSPQFRHRTFLPFCFAPVVAAAEANDRMSQILDGSQSSERILPYDMVMEEGFRSRYQCLTTAM